jgi:hydrophobic/amphiphilic exporter-1 (mainly G- bacteria), HAE1 family
LALSVVLALFASYVVAMTVVPLFCAKLIKGHKNDAAQSEAGKKAPGEWWSRFNAGFNRHFTSFLDRFDRIQVIALARPIGTVIGILGVVLLSFVLVPKLGFAYFPRTDAGQFALNLKAPTGTRIEITEQEVKKVEDLVRRLVDPHDLRLIVSNIGSQPGFSSIYTSNSASHTAYVQVGLTDDHRVGSYDYMQKMTDAMKKEIPELTTYFQSGALVDAVLNQGLPPPLTFRLLVLI